MTESATLLYMYIYIITGDCVLHSLALQTLPFLLDSSALYSTATPVAMRQVTIGRGSVAGYNNCASVAGVSTDMCHDEPYTSLLTDDQQDVTKACKPCHCCEGDAAQWPASEGGREGGRVPREGPLGPLPLPRGLQTPTIDGVACPQHTY